MDLKIQKVLNVYKNIKKSNYFQVVMFLFHFCFPWNFFSGKYGSFLQRQTFGFDGKSPPYKSSSQF